MENVIIIIVIVILVYKILDRLIRIPRLSPGSSNYNILVTGCDSGFGNIFAKRMDRPGFQVFATCLTEDGRKSLDQKTSDRVKTFLMDVTDTKSIQDGVIFVESQLKPNEGIHAVINNAGVANVQAPAEWLSKQHYEKLLSVNLYGVIEVSRLFLPLLRRSGKGRIVNTASILGRIAIPYAAPYDISKFGVEAFSDCLRREVRSFNISVHMIEPGFFRTAMTNPANTVNSLKAIWEQLPGDVKQQYGNNFLTEAIKSTEDTLNLVTSSNVDEVVSCYEHAVTAVFPRARYMAGYDARFLFWPLSLLPEWFSDAFVTAFLPKPRPTKT